MTQRIQRRRTKGWRMPEGAVYVGRGSKWGNPYMARMVRRESTNGASASPKEASGAQRKCGYEVRPPVVRDEFDAVGHRGGREFLGGGHELSLMGSCGHRVLLSVLQRHVTKAVGPSFARTSERCPCHSQGSTRP